MVFQERFYNPIPVSPINVLIIQNCVFYLSITLLNYFTTKNWRDAVTFF